MTAIYEPMTTLSFLDAFSSAILQMPLQISVAVKLMEVWELGVYKVVVCVCFALREEQIFLASLEGCSR
jgi:hypothetical protein